MIELFISRGPPPFPYTWIVFIAIACYSYSTAFWGGSGSWVSLTCSEDPGSGATPHGTFRWFQLHESGFGQGGKGRNEPNELQEEIGERMLTVKRPCQIVHFDALWPMPQHFLPRWLWRLLRQCRRKRVPTSSYVILMAAWMHDGGSCSWSSACFCRFRHTSHLWISNEP